jgi:hypothetical protein
VSTATFAGLSDTTLTETRAVTHDPLLVAETAVAADADRLTQISDLFKNVKVDGLVGFVWFDAPRSG